MYRPASRTVLRAASSLRTARATPTTSRLGARYLTTAPPHKTSRGWKNAALRWGIAGGIVYWYNTTNVFAEEPTNHYQPPESHYDPEPLPTIDSLALQRKQREAAAPKTQIEDAPTSAGPLGDGGVAPGSPEALEAEAGQQGAFNEETGEINWDCPCLGGMADGPCGENFKEAFSCFVFSKEEPKGVDCIEKFKGMQDCFRQHPDIYGAELEDDEDEYEGEEGGPRAPVDSPEASPVPAASTSAPSSLPTPVVDTPAPATKREDPVPQSKTKKAKAATEQVKKDHSPLSESEELVPRAAHDAR